MPGNTNISSECAWCGNSLSSAQEFHAVGATAEDADRIKTEDGEHMIGIEFPDLDRTVFALVPPPGSPARKKQHDLWFNLCSESCAQTLRNQLHNNADLVSNAEIPNEHP